MTPVKVDVYDPQSPLNHFAPEYQPPVSPSNETLFSQTTVDLLMQCPVSATSVAFSPTGASASTSSASAATNKRKRDYAVTVQEPEEKKKKKGEKKKAAETVDKKKETHELLKRLIPNNTRDSQCCRSLQAMEAASKHSVFISNLDTQDSTTRLHVGTMYEQLRVEAQMVSVFCVCVLVVVVYYNLNVVSLIAGDSLDATRHRFGIRQILCAPEGGRFRPALGRLAAPSRNELG
jgi:hypothetical protein